MRNGSHASNTHASLLKRNKLFQACKKKQSDSFMPENQFTGTDVRQASSGVLGYDRFS